jgi:hypothetical protein
MQPSFRSRQTAEIAAAFVPRRGFPRRDQPGAYLAKGIPMSITSTVFTPASRAISSAKGLLRGSSLQSMARALGVAVGAVTLAASYQIAYEEGRTLVQNVRAGSARRRARNTSLLLLLMNSGLPLELQDKLRRSRDAVQTGMALMTSQTLSSDNHQIILAALTKVSQGGCERDC